MKVSNNNKKAYYANDTLFHIIATHSLAHNTFPALQKTGTHSSSAPTPFSPRIRNVKANKFRLLGNGHASPNQNPLCCPYFALPSYRARTSVVGARCHNPSISDICLVLQMYQAKLQLTLNNKLCYMPSTPIHHLILLPALLTRHIA